MKKLAFVSFFALSGVLALAQQPLQDTKTMVLEDSTHLLVGNDNTTCHYPDEAVVNDSSLREHKSSQHEMHKKYKYATAVVSTKKKTHRVSASTRR